MSLLKRGKRVKLSFTLVPNVNEKRVKSRTKQSEAADADINVLMKRYERTGTFVEPGRPGVIRQATFGDFSQLGDLTQTLNLVDEAHMRFMALPATLREKFGNDAAELLRFVNDPVNLVEAIDLKLLPESLRPIVPVVPDVPVKKTKKSSDVVDESET